ncbi:hypothetical protein ElyMa_006091600 [Elysia marginata]|uniref:Uncharacterized protein n=1 Tax=Elysia marginata TaxID=1093978 RepID=A0AAV4GS43_9GAST|nr:hypothetical protein ElyMa_006091600 [Elysia marginata]
MQPAGRKKKYVGQQLTLDDGRLLSTGFREVATEDAQTMIEDTVEMIEELSELYGDDEKDDLFFLQLLKNITSTLSDRASVVKSFSQNFGEMKNLMLGENKRTNFLFCNAHFLLGLSSSCEQAVKEVEAQMISETGQVLGRDKSPVFKSWCNGGESAALRFLRTVASCLGPRGDEKWCSRRLVGIL